MKYKEDEEKKMSEDSIPPSWHPPNASPSLNFMVWFCPIHPKLIGLDGLIGWDQIFNSHI